MILSNSSSDIPFPSIHLFFRSSKYSRINSNPSKSLGFPSIKSILMF
nr:MAG TPA: hypothetical protein [Caudoviricetes sp.]